MLRFGGIKITKEKISAAKNRSVLGMLMLII